MSRADAPDGWPDSLRDTHSPLSPSSVWMHDEDKAEEMFPDKRAAESVIKKVKHPNKDIYHSTPYHREWDALDGVIEFRYWMANGPLAIEQLSHFIQVLLGSPGLEHAAGSEFLSSFPSGIVRRPCTEDVAAIAMALDHVLASNGGKACTLTVGVTDTHYTNDRGKQPRYPVYVRFEKDVAETDLRVPRYTDSTRPLTSVRSWTTDLRLLWRSRRILRASHNLPCEVSLAMQSHGGSDFSVGVDIRDRVTLHDDYLDREGRGPKRGDGD